MKKDGVIAAKFAHVSGASAALDWFTNQALPPDVLRVYAMQGDGPPRAPKAGDNARRDVTWIVAVDLDRAPISKADVLETMRREGGAILSRVPAGV